MLSRSGSCTHAHSTDLLRKTIWRRSGGGFNGKPLYNFSGLKAKDKSKVRLRRSTAVLSSSGEVVRVSLRRQTLLKKKWLLACSKSRRGIECCLRVVHYFS